MQDLSSTNEDQQIVALTSRLLQKHGNVMQRAANQKTGLLTAPRHRLGNIIHTRCQVRCRLDTSRTPKARLDSLKIATRESEDYLYECTIPFGDINLGHNHIPAELIPGNSGPRCGREQATFLANLFTTIPPDLSEHLWNDVVPRHTTGREVPLATITSTTSLNYSSPSRANNHMIMFVLAATRNPRSPL